MASVSHVVSTASPDRKALERAVLSAVAYGDVFEYPLRTGEVHRYLHRVKATPEATAAALERAVQPGGALERRAGYYTLRGRGNLVDVRRVRAARAAQLWPTAIRYAYRIAGLPFVRMVALTGSLVWDNVAHSADIDYLIVTEPDRLWVCRWLIAALGRVARREGVSLCPNYMVSQRALLLAERNLYGAYELARMTPIAGLAMYRRLRRANAWAATYLPNAADAPRAPAGRPQRGRPSRNPLVARLMRLGERALRSPLGAALDRGEMAYRIRKRLKQGAQGEAAYGLDWYKAHTTGHRQRVLAAFTERLHALGAAAP
jgi:hypothetical protein